MQAAITSNLVKSKGGKVTEGVRPSKDESMRIAFIKDPDGYEFKLLEKAPTFEPLNEVMLRVGDIDRSISFYRKVRLVSVFKGNSSLMKPS